MIVRAVLRRTFAAAILLTSVGAHAQIFRAYLASDGNDANACTLPAPCRLLPAALAAVASGGEIWMLDSANYNTATVTVGKSVSILAVPGAVGSILAIGGPAIDIAAAGLKVALRNVVIAPLAGGGGTHGVSLTGASTVTIEHCVFSGLPLRGVYVVGSGKAKIANTIIRHGGDYAVWLENGASVDISGTQMLANSNGGVIVYGITATTTVATVSDSVISGGNDGVKAYTGISGAFARVGIVRSTIADTDKALAAQTNGTGNAQVVVSYSQVVNNTFAHHITGAGAVIGSGGNNQMQFNGGVSGAMVAAPLL